jgi:hypothetical protein
MEVISGADTSYVVASLFAVTHVPQSQQSIASGIVGTTGGIFRSIMTSIAIALISSLPLPPQIANSARHWR